MHIVKRKRHGGKKNRHEQAKLRRRIKRERSRAASIKAKRANHRRKHLRRETRYGIFTIVARYMVKHLQLRELLHKTFTLRKGKNSKFTAVDMIMGLVLAIMLGLERLYHISTDYQDEPVLAQQLGMPAMFSGDTAYRFVNKFGVPLAWRSISCGWRGWHFSAATTCSFICPPCDASTCTWMYRFAMACCSSRYGCPNIARYC